MRHFAPFTNGAVDSLAGDFAESDCEFLDSIVYVYVILCITYSSKEVKVVERITVSLDKETVEELRRFSKQEGVSVSRLVKEAVEKWLLYEKRRRIGEKLLVLIGEKPRVRREALDELEKIRREWR